MDTQNHDEIISQFCAMAGTDPSEARRYLAANDWNIETAVTEYFAEQDEDMQESDEAARRQPGSEPEGRPAEQTLGGGSAGASPGTDISQRHGRRKGIATLGDYTQSSNKLDDDDDDGEADQDFYAGGGKSGLAVQNPDDLKQRIIEKARRTQPPRSDELPERRSYFTGTARTLGGDETPSRVVESASESTTQAPRRVRRTLHFWADGFSVDDGNLYRTDDPHNAEILDGIRQGRAPLSIMNVQPGQEVDVELKQHEGKYVKPKQKYKPFSGAGQRLGSPTPNVQQPAASSAPSASEQTQAEVAKPAVDESQPTVTLQIRLGDGTRLVSRFNTSHTVGDVYEFVTSATPPNQRPWTLMTTFPSKELMDKSAVLGDLADFKRGGVVVQKWR